MSLSFLDDVVLFGFNLTGSVCSREEFFTDCVEVLKDLFRGCTDPSRDFTGESFFKSPMTNREITGAIGLESCVLSRKMQ